MGVVQKKEINSPFIKVKKEKKIDQFDLEVVKEKEFAQKEIIEDIPIVENRYMKKIAIIYPSNKIGRYASSTINTVNAFLIYNNEPFDVETFDTYTENSSSIIHQVQLLKHRGFTKVIAMLQKMALM